MKSFLCKGRYLTCKVDSRELASPVFFFCFLVSGLFDSIRLFVRSFLPNFFLLVFFLFCFVPGREVECGSDLTYLLLLTFSYLTLFHFEGTGTT